MIHVVIRKPRKVINNFMTGVKLSNIDVEQEIDSFWLKLMATLSASLAVPIAWPQGGGGGGKPPKGPAPPKG
mgnify:CR=1 FL=1